MPPYGEVRRWTLISRRTASRLTTKRPSRSLSKRSRASDSASRAVGLGEGVLAHAEAAVLDLQGVAVADGLAADAHLGVRRGELGGVLDQFGQQMGDVGDGGADDGGLGQLPHLHARVVLDFRDGGPYDAGQRDGHAPGAPGRRAGQDDQALGVPPHTGGEVVEPEEVAELVRVVGAALHGVEQGELAVDQDLAAAGEVDEDAGDAAGEFGAFDGGAQRGPVDGSERLADLADLVLGGRSRRGLGLDVDLLAGAQPAHGLRQLVPGDLECAVAQADQFDDEAAADAYGDDQRGGDGGESEEHGRSGRGEEAARDGVGPVGGAAAGVRLDGAHPVADGRVGLVPGGGRDDLGGLAAGGGGEHLVLGRLQLPVGALRGEFSPGGALGAAQIGDGRFGEAPAGRDGSGEQPQTLRGEGLAELRRAEQRVLPGEHLAGPGELQQDAGIGAGPGVLDAGECAGDAEGGGDGGGVLLVRGVPGGLAAEYGGAQGAQFLGAGDELVEPSRHAGRDAAARGDGVAVVETQPA